MPSASTNSNNKNKLMKQASLGCSSGSGEGGGGPDGSASTTSTTSVATSSVGGTTKISIATTAAVQNLSSNTSNAAPIEANNINNSNNSGSSNSNTNTESVSSNNTLSSSTGKGGEKISVQANVVGGASMATNVTGNDTAANNPMRQVITTIEHKIRNLEKRKTKLESYRQIQANGKELSSDQKAAVAKYDAVMATLDFARDLSKQMVQFSKDAEKEQKKQARKDIIAKAQAETAKIREVLVMQNILSCFSDDSVRNDFLNGENGAIKLESTDLDALEQFCFDIQTRRPESADDPTFISIAQKAAEYFSMTIDGRPKQYGDTTFENLRRVFNQIQECGYLDKIYLNVSDSSNVECNEEEATVVGDMPAVPEDNGQRVTNSIDENMEKLNVTDVGGAGSNASNTPNATYVDGTEMSTEQPIVKEQLDQMQKPNPINAMGMPSPPSVSTAAGIAGVSSFAGPMPPPQNRQRSGTTTPVHVTAMYAPQAGGPPQPVPPPQMQQVVAPTAGTIISGLPPQQPSQVAIAAHHRPGASGVGVQLPPGVSPTIPPPMHGGPPPGASYPLTTVRAVEQDFFKQHQQQQQQQQQQQKYVQQMRPLAEVIGGGSFFFLQESELDSPEIMGGGANSDTGGAGVVFESQTPNLMVHVSDVPLTGAVVDLQQQQQSAKKIVSQQQQATQQQQQQQQQQPPQQQLEAQHHTLQQQQQQLQHQQQQPPQQAQPIPTQTFTNQTFPPIQPQPHTQLQRQETTPTPSGAVVTSGGPMASVSKTPTMNSGSNGNTPTAQMFQQPPVQPVAQAKTALYSPDLVMGGKGVVQQQQQQQPQQTFMIMTRLATPQANLPIQSGGGNIPQQQQQQPPQQQQGTHSSGFPFDPMVATFGGYDQVQQQLSAVSTGAQQKLTSGVIPAGEEKSRKLSGNSDPSEAPVVGDWETTIKGHTSRNAVNNNAAKAAALTSALKQHSSGTSVGGNASPLEPTTNKWSTEMNALSGRGNTPPTASHHNNNQNRKNEWSTAGGNGSGNVGGTNYGSDVGGTHTDNTSNHWNANQSQPQQQQQPHQQHENNTGGGGGGGGSGYVRGGGGGRNSNNAYQRRNDDRGRGDRGTGGGTGGGGGGNNNYRNRTNSNYGGGGVQSQQQNGSGRGGGGGGIYFRNNDSAQSGAANSFYQNGGLYTKDGSSGPRYDNGGNNSYRGPRGGGNTNQRNQGPPRTIGRNAGNNSGSNTVGSGGGSGGNSSGGGGGGYNMHPRQTNRMSLGMEKN